MIRDRLGSRVIVVEGPLVLQLGAAMVRADRMVIEVAEPDDDALEAGPVFSAIRVPVTFTVDQATCASSIAALADITRHALKEQETAPDPDDREWRRQLERERLAAPWPKPRPAPAARPFLFSRAAPRWRRGRWRSKS